MRRFLITVTCALTLSAPAAAFTQRDQLQHDMLADLLAKSGDLVHATSSFINDCRRSDRTAKGRDMANTWNRLQNEVLLVLIQYENMLRHKGGTALTQEEADMILGASNHGATAANQIKSAMEWCVMASR